MKYRTKLFFAGTVLILGVPYLADREQNKQFLFRQDDKFCC